MNDLNLFPSPPSLAPPPPRRARKRRRVLLTIGVLGLLPAALIVLSPAPARSQSGPDAERDVSVTVTVQNDSRGSATITNNSETYHYKGILECVGACPGPDPNGCSATNTFSSGKELAPDESATCTMLQMTDPCCWDDGNFVIGAVFEVTDYRTSGNDPWTSLEPHYQYAANIASNEDAGPESPNPDPNIPPQAGNLNLNVDCGASFQGGIPLTSILVDNTAGRHLFKVRARFAIACPTKGTQIPTCYCPSGFCKSYTTGTCSGLCTPIGCESDPNVTCTSCNASCSPSGGCVCDVPGDPIPQCSTSNLSEPPCGAEPDDPIVTPACTPYPKTAAGRTSNEIIWVERVIGLAGGGFKNTETEPLSTCCDYVNSRNRRVCAEIDTIQRMNPHSNGAWGNAPQTFLDKKAGCSYGVHSSKEVSCFDGFLSDPDDPNDTDPTVFCQSPI